MSKTKAFLLSVGIVLVVFLMATVVHESHQLGIAEELCMTLCVAYFLFVSTCFWSDK